MSKTLKKLTEGVLSACLLKTVGPTVLHWKLPCSKKNTLHWFYFETSERKYVGGQLAWQLAYEPTLFAAPLTTVCAGLSPPSLPSFERCVVRQGDVRSSALRCVVLLGGHGGADTERQRRSGSSAAAQTRKDPRYLQHGHNCHWGNTMVTASQLLHTS